MPVINSGLCFLRALEDRASEDRIEKAKGAIDAWIKELEAAKP
jgi:hypothetical protein